MPTDVPALEPITIGGLTVRYLIDGSATKGMGVFELTIVPGANVPPPHSHTHNEECIYALEGLLRYSVDGVVRDLAPGEWMHTPKGSVHAFSNPHRATAKALIVLTPDLGAQYFLDVQEVVNAGGPPDRQKLLAVMSSYGLVPGAPIPAVAQPALNP
ncbi:cupin [Cupriavidus necator]|uniref:Cupin n=2 Tax=Cupriavidus necator TaxID=106590 RepID=A0A1U9UVR5_CUPNE|nr:cupin [Cupriavidus necator]